MVRPVGNQKRKNTSSSPDNRRSSSLSKRTKRRKAAPVTPRRQEDRRVAPYNLRRKSSSLVIVFEPLCSCPHEEIQRLQKLGLNPAQFCSCQRSTRRKQSHILIITISSSDEETAIDRTKEWAESITQDKADCDAEESFNEYASTLNSNQMNKDEEVCPQMSVLDMNGPLWDSPIESTVKKNDNSEVGDSTNSVTPTSLFSNPQITGDTNLSPHTLQIWDPSTLIVQDHLAVEPLAPVELSGSSFKRPSGQPFR